MKIGQEEIREDFIQERLSSLAKVLCKRKVSFTVIFPSEDGDNLSGENIILTDIYIKTEDIKKIKDYHPFKELVKGLYEEEFSKLGLLKWTISAGVVTLRPFIGPATTFFRLSLSEKV